MIEIVDAKFVTSAPNVGAAPESDLQDEVVLWQDQMLVKAHC